MVTTDSIASIFYGSNIMPRTGCGDDAYEEALVQ